MTFVIKVYVYCKYCIFTMDWTSKISYVHIGQYYYYYYLCGGYNYDSTSI